MSRRSIPNSVKLELFNRQFGCCNNRPNNPDPSFMIPGRGKYMCPMWKANNGFLDESGYEADHILEHAMGGTDDISNLQLICPCCHSYKTKLFTRQPRSNDPFTSEERGLGRATMDELNSAAQQPTRKRQRTTGMELGFGNSILSDFRYLKTIT